MNIIIDGTLPTTNEIIRESKKHWSKYRDMKKTYTDLVALSCHTLRPIESKINLVVTWYCKDRRQDPDNITGGMKFILDGLVAAKKIPDDGWYYIGSITHVFKVDKTRPRIHVRIIAKEDCHATEKRGPVSTDRDD